MIQEQVKIRPAAIQDSDQLADLFMKVWHISLKDLVPKDFLNQFSYEKQKQKYIERVKDPHWIFLVAEFQNKIVGMISAKESVLQPHSLQTQIKFQQEIKAMYVDPEFQRQGIGTLLLESIFSELKNQDIKNAMLWCIKSNYKACSFYEKHGGKRIENMPPPTEYSIVPHVIYAWEF